MSNQVIESAINWAVGIANDNSHGYSQVNRWGPDYDCSSLVISAFEQAGVKVREAGATYTGNMRSAFCKCGFKSIPYAKGLTYLVRGDVLLNEQFHTALYLGDDTIVQASASETGGKTGRTGDQTGREIYVGKFYQYSKGWDYVLRYDDSQEGQKVEVTMTVLSAGSRGSEVTLLQVLLNELGFKGSNGLKLTVDGWIKPGGNTEYALKIAQKTYGMTPDGICGKKTWTALLHSRYS